MKLMIKFFAFVLVLGIGGLFVLKRPDGQPWLKVSDFVPDTPTLPKDLPDIGSMIPNSPSEPSKIYRWRDTEGVWHLSDKPPSDGRAAEIVEVDPDQNLIQGVAPKPESQTDNKGNTIGEPNGLPSLTTVPMSDIPKLIEDAKELQDLVDQRQKQLEEQINQ